MAKLWRAAASASGSIRTALLNPNSPSFLYRNSSYHTIQAVPRECSGARLSSRERAQGKIPAIVISQDLMDTDPSNRSSSRKFLLTTEKKQIQAILNTVELPYFCSTVFPLQIRAGSGSSVLLESGNVLPIKIHRDKETGKIMNLVFVWADEGKDLKVDVPVVFKGEDVCPGLRKGGYLKKKRTSLRYSCPAEHVPAKVEVDVSNLDIGDKIIIDDIQLHPAIKLLSKSHEDVPIICKVVAAKSDEEDGRGPSSSSKSEEDGGLSSPPQQV